MKYYLYKVFHSCFLIVDLIEIGNAVLVLFTVSHRSKPILWRITLEVLGFWCQKIGFIFRDNKAEKTLQRNLPNFILYPLYRVFSLGVFYTVYGITMQSGDLNFMFRENKGPIIYFPKRKNMTSSFPLCLHFSYRFLYMQANTRDYNIRISWYINSYIHIDYILIIYILINKTLRHSPLWDLLSLTFTCLYPECCFIIQSHQLSLPSD